MVVAKPMVPMDPSLQTDVGGIDVELPDEMLDEDADEYGFEGMESAHDDNLAETLEDSVLTRLGSDVTEYYRTDMSSRSEWADSYVRGMDLLGLSIEDRTQPFEGASGVFHPILMESVIRFQAQAMGELFPASGPARTKIVGEETAERMDQAKRVENELNHMTTDVMSEYRDEMEMMLFRLPLAGSAFKKIYHDPIEDRPMSMFVPAEDLIVNYGASSLKTATRVTHRMMKSQEELDHLMASGFYRDVDLSTPAPEKTDIQKKYDEMSGEREASGKDDRYTLLECHVMTRIDGLDDDGLPHPYVVTVELGSSQVLSVRRNWYAEDRKRKRRCHFVHYRYLPGMGFYGIGLIHTLGGLTKTATSILRQLIDAGTLSNLPAGFKTRGLKVKGDNTPFVPGEFRDVDVPAGAIGDNIFALPFKEPSTVLHALLGDVISEARRMGSVADVDMSALTKEAPVGTTLALMERSLKVLSGVQARLHAAMKEELRLIARCIHDYMPPQYDYEVKGNFSRQQDFDGRVDVIPVSDPNAATIAQRIVMYQSAITMASQAPQVYNIAKLHRQALEVMGIKNAGDIVSLPDEVPPMDPITENMAILKQEAVKTYLYQDHEAHIKTHMAAMNDPKIQQIVGQSPFAEAIMSAMHDHITGHVAYLYRRQMEEQLGVSLPDPEAPLPDDVELEVSRMAAEAAGRLLGKHQAEAAAEEAQRQLEDPLTQIQLRELQIKERAQSLDEEIERGKLEIERERNLMNIDVQKERITAENKRKGAEIGADVAKAQAEISSREKIEGAKIGLTAAKDLVASKPSVGKKK